MLSSLDQHFELMLSNFAYAYSRSSGYKNLLASFAKIHRITQNHRIAEAGRNIIKSKPSDKAGTDKVGHTGRHRAGS